MASSTRSCARLRRSPDSALVEIGPGLGALTNPVVERSEKLTVVELDRDLRRRACASAPS